MDQDGRLLDAQTRSPKMPLITARGLAAALGAGLSAAGTPDGFVQNARRSRSTIRSSRNTTRRHLFRHASLNFAEDANNTLWLSTTRKQSRGRRLAQYKMYFETGDAAKSQGWTALIVDTTAMASATKAITSPPRARLHKDTDPVGFYGIAWSPRDGSLWARTRASGYILRMAPGENRPTPRSRRSTKSAPWLRHPGMDVDRKGVVWCRSIQPHRSFDRTLCKGPLNAPARAWQQMSGGLEILSLRPRLCGDSGAAENPYTPGRPDNILASAPTCRSRPVTSRTRCTRWSAAR